MVVLACESLHVCTVCIWRCEHARFCGEGFYMPYINFHSFIHTLAKVRELPVVTGFVSINQYFKSVHIEVILDTKINKYIIIIYTNFPTGL